MATELNVEAILAGLPEKGFSSAPFHSREADCIQWYFRDCDHYAERVDAWLTIYLDMQNDEMVGFKLKNIDALMSAFDQLGLEVRVSPGSWQVLLKRLVAFSPVATMADSRRYHEVVSEIKRERAVDLVPA